MVYVISKNGQPLMPTENYAKVRILLKNKKAKVTKRCPFTIQLAYDSTNYTQEVSLGIDAGSKHIGVSVTTESKVLYEADVELRNDIVDLLSTRVFGRRNSGFFDIRTLDGVKVNKGSISYKKIQLVEKPKLFLTERQDSIS